MKLAKSKKTVIISCGMERILSVAAVVRDIAALGKIKREFLVCLCLDKNNKLIEWIIFPIGKTVRKIDWVAKFFSLKSKQISTAILAVKRVRGGLEMEERDRCIAKQAAVAGKTAGINVLDYIIVSDKGNSSLLEVLFGAQSGGAGYVAEGCQRSFLDLLENKKLFLNEFNVSGDVNAKYEKKLKIIDLFAGIGGFHLAFHNVGADCVFAAEWDEPACKTYRRNFNKIAPQLFNSGNFVGDITKIDPKSIPAFNILCAGFPCQPFSQAGFKKGFNETRGTLFFNIANIIKEKKPDAFFLENVRHLFKHDKGRTFNVIKNVIEKDLGYSFFYKIIKASDYGLPQHRPRLYMVGFKNKEIDFKFPDPLSLRYTMSDVLGGICNKKIGFTLRVGGRGTKISDRRNWDSYLVDGRVKRIGPREGLKMQGFPDNFEFPVTDVQAMKQLGNSVAVPAIQVVANEIVKKLRNYEI